MEETIGSKGIIKKSDYIRIIIDALNSLEFDGIGTQLEAESGIHLHSPTAKQFLKEVKDREWDKSIATLKELSDENPVKFLLLEQKFFDFLKNEKVMDAVRTLRSEMVPLGVNTKRVHELATKLISRDTESVDSWSKVVKELHNLLPTGVIIPEKRLEYLLEYSLLQQRQCCYLHNVPDSDLSICSDHDCGDRKVPSVTVQILKEHKGEVRFVKFSHNGKYLASSSTDKTAIIWEMDKEGKFLLKYRLEGHENPVVSVLWSPDDKEVITCGENEDIRRWDVATGQCSQSYAKDGVGSVSCGWFHDGSGIIGGMDDRSICLWKLDGTEIVEHELGLRAQKLSDVAMTNDGKYIVSLGKEPNEISLFNRATKVRTVIQEEDMITSFSLSEDGKLILINLITQKSRMWTYDGEPIKCFDFSGHKRSRFIIRSCFGGYKENFIASGSEDSQVYIWSWRSRIPFLVLPGHAAVVNCVSWNPIDMHMLASGSDDTTIRIWGLDQRKMK